MLAAVRITIADRPYLADSDIFLHVSHRSLTNSNPPLTEKSKVLGFPIQNSGANTGEEFFLGRGLVSEVIALYS